MSYAWFSLGGNVGDVAETFARARRDLRDLASSPMRLSGLYASEPVGGPSQAPFVNQVVGFRPRYSPLATLRGLWHIERDHGRDRTAEVRWGPRPLDIDILIWPDTVLFDHQLTLPHPRLAQRRFVLAPLASVDPDIPVPGLDRTVGELLAACKDPHWVKALPA